MISARSRLEKVRRSLIAISGFLFLGTIGELIAEEHYNGFFQLLPFVLCGLGIVGLAVIMVSPAPGAILGVRVMMVAISGSSLIGIWKHIEGNIGFYNELHRTAPATQVLNAALTGGNPLLAPGILAVAALLAIIASTAIDQPAKYGVNNLAGQ